MRPESSALDRATVLVRDMQAAADGGDWERLAALQAQLQPLLHPDLHAQPNAENLLPELLDNYRHVLALVAAARDAAAGALRRSRHGHASAQAYLTAAHSR